MFFGYLLFPYYHQKISELKLCAMRFLKLTILLYLAIATTAHGQNNESGQRLSIRVYLEGALINNGNAISQDGRPLMRDNLRFSPFNGLNYLPASDPYQQKIGDVDLKITNAHVAPGNRANLCKIYDPDAVFGVIGDDAIVDWVFVEIRKAGDPGQVLATRSCLLQRDGDIVDVDGLSAVWFPEMMDEIFHVVVRHRNHLGVMSKIVTADQLIDFTSTSQQLFDFGTTKAEGYDFTNMAQKTIAFQGYRALWAGDFNADRKIKFSIPNDDLTTAFYEQDFTGTGYSPGYYQGDFNMNSVVTFSGNPNDALLLEVQAKNYTLNPSNLPNFNFFIEQVPDRN